MEELNNKTKVGAHSEIKLQQQQSQSTVGNNYNLNKHSVSQESMLEMVNAIDPTQLEQFTSGLCQMKEYIESMKT